MAAPFSQERSIACCYFPLLLEDFCVRAPRLKMSGSGSDFSGPERGYAPLPPPMTRVGLPANYMHSWQFLRAVFPAFEDCALERVVKFIYPGLGKNLTWVAPPPGKPPWWFWGQGSGCRRRDLASKSVTVVGDNSEDRQDVQQQRIFIFLRLFLIIVF